MSSTSSVWVKQFSKKHSVDYWFNTETGQSQWTPPPEWEESSSAIAPAAIESKKRKRNEDVVTVAIIVPFRDLHPEQSRSKHLAQFIPHITTYYLPYNKPKLNLNMCRFFSSSEVEFKIFIIQQSNDGRRFNRGKLLNIGFDLAKQQHCTLFVFHDVDLLPSANLLPYYTTLPSGGPVHIARRWGRYSNNPDYFGGVVAFTEAQYNAINGFPNTYWGWGGEDDEMIKRVREVCVEHSSNMLMNTGWVCCIAS